MTEAETAVREALAKMTPGTLIAAGWGDGSTQMGMTNIFNEDAEVLLAECIPEHDAAGIVALRNHTPALLAELDAARAEVARLRRCLLPVSMSLAYAELAKGEPVADDAVVLSFNGGGGSDFVTAGEIRAALEARHD